MCNKKLKEAVMKRVVFKMFQLVFLIACVVPICGKILSDNEEIGGNRTLVTPTQIDGEMLENMLKNLHQKNFEEDLPQIKAVFTNMLRTYIREDGKCKKQQPLSYYDYEFDRCENCKVPCPEDGVICQANCQNLPLYLNTSKQIQALKLEFKNMQMTIQELQSNDNSNFAILMTLLSVNFLVTFGLGFYFWFRNKTLNDKISRRTHTVSGDRVNLCQAQIES